MLRFLPCPAATLFGILFSGSAFAADEPALRMLISRSDLRYPAPVERHEDGLPLGNGRMGSLVWTSPTALRFQIHRNDVQSMNKDPNSFLERNSDYMGGCAFVGIDLGGEEPGTSSPLKIVRSIFPSTTPC